MNIKRWNGKVLGKREWIDMLAKPTNMAFIIEESKSETFKKIKKSSKLDEILKLAKGLNIKSK